MSVNKGAMGDLSPTLSIYVLTLSVYATGQCLEEILKAVVHT